MRDWLKCIRCKQEDRIKRRLRIFRGISEIKKSLQKDNFLNLEVILII